MTWNFDSNLSLYLQIIDEIRKNIICGVYAPGDRVPSVRQLAMDASVNPNTVQRAFSLLEEEGLLVSKSTTGRYVTEDAERIAKEREKERLKTVKELLKAASSLGITPRELIEMIKKESGIDE